MFVCILAACVVPLHADTNVWTGAAGTNWFDYGNWSLGARPDAGENVLVPSGTPYSPTLTNATGALSSFVLQAGQTLTLHGWQSALQAVSMTIAGTVTHSANNVTTTNASGQWVPLHRVLLQGLDITITASGEVDADHRGYPPGAGPGAGAGFPHGAAHAGLGIRGVGGVDPVSRPYGDPAAPEQPGSGGGIASASGPGGGVVRILVAGCLTVEGEIRARGQDATGAHGAGGAGGSIWMACDTFAGSATGLIAVDGGDGNYHGAEGSAGRMALYYDVSAQATSAVPVPPVRFSGPPGGHVSPRSTDDIAAMSTLYLPDTLFLEGPLGRQRFRHTRFVIPGFTSEWRRASLTLDDCIIGLPTGMDLVVTNDLVLTNGAGLHVWAAPVSDPLLEDGALVSVGNDLRVAADSWIHPYCDPTNGATVRFVVGNDLLVLDTGGFDADYTGYGLGSGPGKAPNAASGASYGGLGGPGGYSEFRTPTYGDPAGPVQAGSASAYLEKGGQGGGAIRIEAGGKAEIHGLLTARGARGMRSHGSAGAGGGISVACTTFEGSNTGLLRVDGGRGDYRGGNGGGGRIAVLYDAASQQALPEPRPPVRFSAHAYERTTELDMIGAAGAGTLYFPDMTMLAPTGAASVVLDRHRFWYVRPVVGNGGLDAWEPASLVVSNCVIDFADGFDLAVQGGLTVASGGTLPADLALEPADANGPEGPRSGLHLRAPESNTLYGARLDVGGDLHIGTNAWIFPHTCGSNDAMVGVFVGGDVTVEDGGGINADGLGYISLPGNTNGPGAGQHSYYGGGGYGGAGGGSDGGGSYGLAVLPLELGSPAGFNGYGGDGSVGGPGGGAVHLHAGGSLTIDGALSANGHRGNDYRGAGGSGGSIFISGTDLSGSGQLRAKGGACNDGETTDGYGGGGRIAVWYGPALASGPARIAQTDTNRLMSGGPSVGFSGTLSVGGGGGTTAQEGTAGVYYVRPSRRTLIEVQ